MPFKFSNMITTELSSTTTIFSAMTMTMSGENSSTTEFDATPGPLSLCPRELWELVFGLCISVAIILSNSVCAKIIQKTRPTQHPQNRHYLLNLAASNLLCGLALFTTNCLELSTNVHKESWLLETCYESCTFWGPIYIFCIMCPYVALANLTLDIALYCHHSIEYGRKMSRWKVCGSIAAGWIYTLLVVAITVSIEPDVLCDKYKWEVNIYFIVFPLFLMFLPAVCVVIVFTWIIHNYWKASQKMERRMSISKTSRSNNSKSDLMKRFVHKFSHLIFFSILCSLVYTTLTIVEVLIENENHRRICVIYRIDRLFISFNSFLSPWIHCLATREMRSKLCRKYSAWKHNSEFRNRTQSGTILQPMGRWRERSNTSTVIGTIERSRTFSRSTRHFVPKAYSLKNTRVDHNGRVSVVTLSEPVRGNKQESTL